MVQENDREQHRGAVRWNRDLGSAIQEAQRKVAEQVPLPAGSRMEWVGELGNLQDAIARLKIVVPLSLALIALLLLAATVQAAGC